MLKKYSLIFTIFSLMISLSCFAETIEYTVKRGDTLYSLSRTYDVPTETIMEINGISSPDQLKTGIILRIPHNNLDYNQNKGYNSESSYHVNKGDTYYSISRNNGMSVSELLEMNDLSINHVLHEGDRLLVASDSSNQSAVPPVDSEPIISGLAQNSVYWPINGARYKMDGKLQGVRINAEAYSYVRSIAAGKVVLAEPYRGFGNVILIDVNGYIYLYGGNEDVFVNVGEEVAAGTRIGRLGLSDLSNGKKDMFFSVFKDGKPIDTSTAPRG